MGIHRMFGRRFSSAYVEICLISLAILLCWQWLLAGMVEHYIRSHAAAQGQEKAARLFRLFERQHVPISPYDDVGLEEIDFPIYLVEVPVESGIMRRLNDSDFTIIDQRALARGYKELGRGPCGLCPYRHTDIPFMNITIRTAQLNGTEYLTILGFERLGYTPGQWIFAVIVFGCVCFYFYVGLSVSWHLHLKHLVFAFVGLPPTEDPSIIFRHYKNFFDLDENALMLLVHTYMLIFVMLGILLLKYS